MNTLYIRGEIEYPRGGFLCLCDEVSDIARSRVFDPLRHSFNVLKNINYRGAVDFVSNIEALFDRGNSTLTKDSGLDHLFDQLERGGQWLDKLIARPDKKAGTGEIWAYSKIERILRSWVLRRVFCNRTNFSFNPRSMIFARLNRAELGDFDCLAVGLFLMAHFKGQIITDAFYLRPHHVELLTEQRLIARCQTLSQLPANLRDEFLQGQVIARGATFDDAVTLAKQARLVEGTNEFHEFVAGAMS